MAVPRVYHPMMSVRLAASAFARGRWVRRPRRGGDDISQTVVLTLREEKGDWRILEIRTSR